VILADETGIVAVVAVSELVGGKAETDCAYAVAVTAASNPTAKAVDLSKLCMLNSPVLHRIYVAPYFSTVPQ
jgi:hypothetical protein